MWWLVWFGARSSVFIHLRVRTRTVHALRKPFKPPDIPQAILSQWIRKQCFQRLKQLKTADLETQWFLIYSSLYSTISGNHVAADSSGSPSQTPHPPTIHFLSSFRGSNRRGSRIRHWSFSWSRWVSARRLTVSSKLL